ncbi:hypothetical protein ACETRX_36610 [Labrys portucalensis]|uniref:Uncharacterized protein n=1 Tax=Labrys neptuniae TaxID=376174 RepID=A0ABV6ZSD8_9HYPH
MLSAITLSALSILTCPRSGIRRLALLATAVAVPAMLPFVAHGQTTVFNNSVNFYRQPPQDFCPLSNSDCFNSSGPLFNNISGWGWKAGTAHNFTTTLGASIAEANAAFNAWFGSGYTASWTANTNYVANDERILHDSLYVQTVANCTSGGTGPSGNGNNIVDGSCLWNYEVSVHAAGKINLGVYTRVPADVDPKHPKSSNFNWGIYNNLTIDGNRQPGFWSGMEIGITNNGPNCYAAVGQNCTGLLIDGFVNNHGGMAIAVAPQTNSKPGWQYGMMLGQYTSWWASLAIEDDARYGIAIGDIKKADGGLHAHAGASIFEQTQSPIGLQFSGIYSTAAIDTTGTQPSSNGSPIVAMRLGSGHRICLSGDNDCIYSNAGIPTLAAGQLTIQGNAPRLVLQDASGVGAGWRFATGAKSTAPGELVMQSTPPGGGFFTATNFLFLHPSTGSGDNDVVRANVPVRLPAYTVASLPACNASIAGGVTYVTDAMTPAYNSALSGGGTTRTLAMCNGSQWTAH